jgi:hypothetical protein
MCLLKPIDGRIPVCSVQRPYGITAYLKIRVRVSVKTLDWTQSFRLTSPLVAIAIAIDRATLSFVFDYQLFSRQKSVECLCHQINVNLCNENVLARPLERRFYSLHFHLFGCDCN